MLNKSAGWLRRGKLDRQPFRARIADQWVGITPQHVTKPLKGNLGATAENRIGCGGPGGRIARERICKKDDGIHRAVQAVMPCHGDAKLVYRMARIIQQFVVDRTGTIAVAGPMVGFTELHDFNFQQPARATPRDHQNGDKNR